ncbi:rRNA methylase [Longilinea arvoryzae]|uniref:rRNA methylase n=1 Tax=Longilinea arvoryzae TaxID=360412 RepID=A0A0S7BJZ9_9CHLR|nr:RNA methyltransferase [Longilinea arvoryzae]GAP14530.1 rRNA methylase [Longilinea arvoryzae]
MITSTANPRIKEIRKLRERKERQATGLFYIEGLRIVGEAVQQGARIETLISAPELLISDFGQKLVQNHLEKGGQVLEVSEQVFQSFSLKEGPQGIAAILTQKWTRLADVTAQPGDCWVVLDSVADPGNLGTILRTSDSTGCRGVILLDQSTDPYDPSCIRASMGALFSQKLVKASFDEFLQWKKSSGIGVVGTSDKAEQDYHTYEYPRNLAILMGSERQGLQPRHLELCDAVVRIPMVGISDSLNLAVATAVVLYEVFNQKQEVA